jgi:hypothetical protein
MKFLLVFFAIMITGVQKQNIQGAWEAQKGDMVITMIISDGYLAAARYNVKEKKFLGAHGGTIVSYHGEFKGITEFDSEHREAVGKEYKMMIRLSGDDLESSFNGNTVMFRRIDDGSKNLSGNWRITQREQNGTMVPIHTTGARKTIKMLSSTRFQWAAINTETGEFSGTGGGRYSFVNGKYTETIDFFSRDSSRVGMSLTFNGKLEGNNWYHSGKSSKGDPINEVWTKLANSY